MLPELKSMRQKAAMLSMKARILCSGIAAVLSDEATEEDEIEACLNSLTEALAHAQAAASLRATIRKAQDEAEAAERAAGNVQ